MYLPREIAEAAFIQLVAALPDGAEICTEESER
jgi:hypothetical protein